MIAVIYYTALMPQSFLSGIPDVHGMTLCRTCREVSLQIQEIKFFVVQLLVREMKLNVVKTQRERDIAFE